MVLKRVHYSFLRMCLGPMIGGALVYKVGFPSMAAVRLSVVSCYARHCLHVAYGHTGCAYCH